MSHVSVTHFLWLRTKDVLRVLVWERSVALHKKIIIFSLICYTFYMEEDIHKKINQSLEAISKVLNVDILDIAPLQGGTNERTFLAQTNNGEFVVRIEDIGGLQLRRAYNAQEWARSLGVRIPHVLAYSFDNAKDGLWTVEEKIDGAHFYPDKMNDTNAKATAIDLGRQLRLLHSKSCDKFGLIPPYPYNSYEDWEKACPEQVRKSADLTGPVFKNFREYLTFKERKIQVAAEILGIHPDKIDEIKNIYSQLKYEGRPKFCGGDTATSNILVCNGRVAALVDLEWAHGGDPAENIAGWSYWNNNIKHLDNLLEGYKPKNLIDFRKRVLLYEIVCAINLARVYREMADEEGIKQTKETLERKLVNKHWE